MLLDFDGLLLNIKIKYYNIQDSTKDTIENLVKYNFEYKMSSYIKKINDNTKLDKITFVVKLTLNKKNKYDGTFEMLYTGIKDSVRYQREDYENLDDLINHAFDNMSQRIPDLFN